jgi:O-antigen ligase
VHNTYLHILAELGAVGLALFAGALVVAMCLGWRACRLAARAGDRSFETEVRGLLIGAVGMLVAFAFLTAQYEKQLWLVLGLLLVAHTLARALPVRET